ncbi:ubiquinone biosynthesis accessory factor UbiJ [Thiosocius teredinicola]|uniref:ubiquinone biosynthesis accessory factor UbiJ n=1 Tax=Thiosocius teredinicola TaxID=1973002 RepID=UPI0009912E4B
MTLRDLALEGLEQSINAVIALDPDAARRLATLHGSSVRIELSGTGIALNMVPGHDGRLQMLGSIEGEPDCTLRGSAFDLMRANEQNQGTAQLFAGRVSIDGDAKLAQRFSEALGSLDIDWEEQLSRLTGDIAAHEIGRGVRAAMQQGARMRDSAEQNLSEYLTEETRVLPHRYEVEDFVSDVDTLRDDVERLEARIALLEKARRGDGA